MIEQTFRSSIFLHRMPLGFASMGANASARRRRGAKPARDAPALSPPVRDAMDAIRRLVRTLRVSATSAERETGLSGAQTFVLQLLAEGPADSMNDLAGRTATDQSSVSVVVSRLEARGLVRRASSSADARRTTVRITPAGRRLLAGRPVTAQARLLRALESIAPDALATVARELTHITARMGAGQEPASMFFEDDATSST